MKENIDLMKAADKDILDEVYKEEEAVCKDLSDADINKEFISVFYNSVTFPKTMTRF